MLDLLIVAVTTVVAYLLGMVPSGYLVAKLYGVDIQRVGSGNIGATNVLRAVGVVPAVIVVVLDPLKGALAVLLPQLVGVGPWGVALAGLAAVLGNNFNALLKFRGGKGIATSLGVMLALEPLVALFCIVLGLFAVLISRFVSLGSLIGMLALPLFLIARGSQPAILILGVALSALAVLRHRTNMARLLAGTENRLGQRVEVERRPRRGKPPRR